MVGLLSQLAALFHQTVTKSDVKVQGPLPERLGKASAILGAVQGFECVSPRQLKPAENEEQTYWLFNSKLTRNTESLVSSFLCRMSNKAWQKSRQRSMFSRTFRDPVSSSWLS